MLSDIQIFQKPQSLLMILLSLAFLSTLPAYADDDGTRDLGLYDYTKIDSTDLSKSKFEKDDRDDEDDHRDDDSVEREEDRLDHKKPFEKKDWTSDFIDTDFRKESFMNDFERPDRKRYADDRKIKSDDPHVTSDDDKSRSDLVKWMRKDADKRDYSDRKGDMKAVKELTKTIPGILHDWVPSKVDRLHNGGFGIEPDNGFPVPYRLNGHLDIQRKLPWEKEPP